MTEALRASVIVSNCNYGRFLGEAIDSVLVQQYGPLEVIVVDDGSTDESRDVIARYSRRIVPVFKENGGMGSAYNAGFEHASGEIVFMLDADDALLPGAVENVVPLFTDGAAAKVHWPLAEVDADGRRTGRLVPSAPLPEGDLHRRIIHDGPDAYASPPTSGNAWSRRLLEAVLPLPEQEFRRHADVYLTTLAPLFGSVRKVPEPQACYRVHGANDYAGRTAVEKCRSNLQVYASRCAALSQCLRRLGVDRTPGSWMQGNTRYEWLSRMVTAADELMAAVPAGETLILADAGEWSDTWGASVVPDRTVRPFLERDGCYWGAPADDENAVSELERMRREGARYAAFAWSTFWWLDAYAGFSFHLRSRYAAVLENERLVVFDLTSGVL